MQGSLTLAATSVVGLIMSGLAVPQAATDDDISVDDVNVDEMLEQLGIDDDWIPDTSLDEVEVGGAPPSEPWSPERFVELARSGAQSAPSPLQAGPSTINQGTGDLGYYSFVDFPFFGQSDEVSVRVNIANGNLLVQVTESAIAGPGMPVDIARVYNSNNDLPGDIANQWSTNIGLMGLSTGSGAKTFYGESGFSVTFTGSGSSYTAPSGFNAALTQNPDSTWTVSFNRTGEQIHFSSQGWPIGKVDRNGVGVAYGYTGTRLTSVTDATGKSVGIDYTPIGTIDQITDQAGRSTTMNINNSSVRHLTSVSGYRGTWSMGYSSSNQLTSLHYGGKVMTFEYAGQNDNAVTKVIQSAPGQPSVETSFARSGGETVVTDPRGNTATYEVDSQLRVTKVTDQLGNARSQSWTPNSDVATTTDALGLGPVPGNVTTAEYDSLNNQTSVTLPTGAATRAIYTAGVDCADAQPGNPYLPKCTIDASGNSSSLEYDTAGNLTTRTDTTVGGGAAEQSYVYENPAGTVCGGVAGQICSVADANGNETFYEYTNGDLTLVTPPGPLGETAYEYDALSRLVKVTDGNGDVTEYGYDQRDRIISTTFDDTTAVYTAWNQDGTMAGQLDSTAWILTEYDYDLLGHVTSRSVDSPLAYLLPASTASSYDAMGNLLSHTDPGGTVNYSYDAANRLVSLQEPGGTCPASGAPAANSGCVLFEYDGNGAETARVFPGGARVETERDNSGRTVQIVASDANDDTVADIGYSYLAPGGSGPSGDRTLIQSRTSTKEQGITPGAVTSYAYDSLNRVVSAIEQSGSTTTASWEYGYDPVGNRTSQTRIGATGASAGSISYGYDAANQLISATGDTTSWTYDAVGNQTRNGTTGVVSNYGERGQVTTIGSAWQSYLGTGNGERTFAGSTSFASSILGLAARETGALTQRFIRAGDGSAVSYRSPAPHYYVHDHLGSVIGLFSGSGIWLGGYSYSPYGEERFTATNAAVADNVLRYIAGELDESGLHKLGARYYDPTQGRFTQTDPSGQETNPFAYAGADPINSLDPSGLISGRQVRNAAIAGLATGLVTGCITGAVATSPTGPGAAGGCGAGAVLGGIVGTVGGAVGSLVTQALED